MHLVVGSRHRPDSLALVAAAGGQFVQRELTQLRRQRLQPALHRLVRLLQCRLVTWEVLQRLRCQPRGSLILGNKVTLLLAGLTGLHCLPGREVLTEGRYA